MDDAQLPRGLWHVCGQRHSLQPRKPPTPATGAMPQSTSTRMMWRMRQHDEPSDYVEATGTSHTVRDFLRFAFEHAGLDWEKHVKFDDRYLRPTEVDSLIGTSSKAAELLHWKPEVLTPQLACIKVDADIVNVGRKQMRESDPALWWLGTLS
jgi:GDP-mannose 4,6 dehydratase